MSEPPVLLVVDDEERILSAIRRTLRREGYRILTARGVAEAERVLAEETVDLLLADQKMPDGSGLDLLERTAERQPSVRRLLITGWTGEIQPRRLAQIGVRATIEKPWDDGDFKLTLKKALEG